MPNSPSPAPVDGVEAAPTPVPGVDAVEVLAGAVLLETLVLVVDDSGAVALEVELVVLELLSDDVDDVEVLLLVLEVDELLVELLEVLEVVDWVVELVLEVLVVVPGHSYDALFVVVPSNEPTVPETCTRQAL